MACDEEFSDSEDEGEGGRRDRSSFKPRKRARQGPYDNDAAKDGDKEGGDKKDVKADPDAKASDAQK